MNTAFLRYSGISLTILLLPLFSRAGEVGLLLMETDSIPGAASSLTAITVSINAPTVLLNVFEIGIQFDPLIHSEVDGENESALCEAQFIIDEYYEPETENTIWRVGQPLRSLVSR
jgi:hypothetical protein